MPPTVAAGAGNGLVLTWHKWCSWHCERSQGPRLCEHPGVDAVVTAVDTERGAETLGGRIRQDPDSPSAYLVEADGGWARVELDALTTESVGSDNVWLTALFSIESDEYAVRDVRRRVLTLARSVGLDRDSLEAIETAVGEAALNAVKHGRPPLGRGILKVRCINQKRAFVVEVTDQGPGFQPSDVPSPVAERLKPSGYGIALMRGLVDKVTFRKGPVRGTTVRLVKLKRPRRR